MTFAMIIFKFAKPKIVNYEVVHYPHPVEHAHIHAHAPPPHVHPVVFEPTPGWARSIDAQQAAYNAYV